jgi:hypothetical protein
MLQTTRDARVNHRHLSRARGGDWNPKDAQPFGIQALTVKSFMELPREPRRPTCHPRRANSARRKFNREGRSAREITAHRVTDREWVFRNGMQFTGIILAALIARALI